MRLFHFSDHPDIGVFAPRAVAIPTERAAGMEWLNGPLVWAIDESHQPLYLFPRQCPRILIWSKKDSTPEDQAKWCAPGARMTAYIESDWVVSVNSAQVVRYELTPTNFETLYDAGMWVSRQAAAPIAIETIRDLPNVLKCQGVELRAVENLALLREIWATSLHASGIRLRNSRTWNEYARM